VFGVPFDEIAAIVERSPAAARQLASRARRRVRGAPVPDPDIKAQRAVVDAFMAAAREGDFDGLIAVLDPEVVLRSDGGRARPGLIRVIQGAEAVAAEALAFRRLGETATPVLVNGAAGMIAWTAKGEPFAVASCTVQGGRIVSMEFMADPDRMRELDLTILVD
jgi:RNA polymerase sigma-70 factor (ECF subfamily)